MTKEYPMSNNRARLAGFGVTASARRGHDSKARVEICNGPPAEAGTPSLPHSPNLLLHD